MKLMFDRNDLVNGLSTVIKAIPQHTTMPVLECIFIEAKDNSIVAKAFDMELGISTHISGEIIEEGQAAIDAKMFLNVASKMPDGEVLLSINENFTCTIKSGKIKFDIQCRNAEDFPEIPEVYGETDVVMSQYTLKEIIRQTIFSVADDKMAGNKVMTGELFEVSGDSLKVTSLDGHRIAIRKTDLRNSYNPVSAIIPGKTLTEISKILSGDVNDDVTLSFTKLHVCFTFGMTTVVSRTIDGQFFDIEKMIQMPHDTTVTVNKRDLIGCIDRALVLVKEGDRKPLVMETQDGFLSLSMKSTIGQMDETLDGVVDGKPIKIGMNPKFVIDVLKVVDEEEITIYLSGAKNPCIIKDEGSYLYLVLPVAMK